MWLCCRLLLLLTDTLTLLLCVALLLPMALLLSVTLLPELPLALRGPLRFAARGVTFPAYCFGSRMERIRSRDSRVAGAVIERKNGTAAQQQSEQHGRHPCKFLDPVRTKVVFTRLVDVQHHFDTAPLRC